jgi:C4-dicarboxylate-specific signal transduction histidine kinase
LRLNSGLGIVLIFTFSSLRLDAAAVLPGAQADENPEARVINPEGLGRVSFTQLLSLQNGGVLLPVGSGAFAFWLLALWRRGSRDKMAKTKKYSNTLLMLSNHPSMRCGDLQVALAQIADAAAQALEVQEVSVWLLDETRSELRCKHFLDGEAGALADTGNFQAAKCSAYLQSLRLQLIIAAENAHSDRRLAELVGTCLLPSGIKSALHAAVRLDGELAGLVAFHQTGLRRWDDDEITFAGGLAEQVAQVMLNDVQRQAQLELDQRRHELAHLARVLEFAELSGSLAHHLNQPLTAILINAEAAMGFLQPQKLDLEEVRSILRDILADGKRAGEMIQKVRSLFTKSDLRQPVNLNELVQDVLKIASADLAKQNVAVATQLAENLPNIDGNRVQLQHLLLNLLANACDAMSEIVFDDRKLLIRTEVVESGVQLSLTDRGAGVPAQQMEQIFQPFFTTRDKRIGLGLTVCRSIASTHGGELWACSESDCGTTFHLLLPQMKAGC